jgi:predicted nucleic acid-binding protein
LITAIDTNIFSAILNQEPGWRDAAEDLSAFRLNGPCVMAGPVYAELMAHPAYSLGLDVLLREAGIRVDFDIDEPIWRAAGLAYAAYLPRRKRSGGGPPRRILADFVIGAHAQLRADQLFTFDDDFYRRHIPGLNVVSIPGTSA